MLVKKGEKLIVTKDIADFLKVGEVVEITDVNNNLISFTFKDGMHMGLMNNAECEAHFTKYVEPKEEPSVTQEMIDDIILKSTITIDTIHDKCTIMTCKLPNGFVIVESSACVSPENYDEELGAEICMEKIINKVWELEGYKLQSELYELGYYSEECDGNCEECDCCEDCEELDKCLDTDLDCDECDDYDCYYNPMHTTINKLIKH